VQTRLLLGSTLKLEESRMSPDKPILASPPDSRLADQRFPARPTCGEMAALIKQHAWDATPLGPMHAWSPTLVSMVQLILNSPHPAALYWGSEMIMIYNDPYRDSLEHRHPNALGRPAAPVWDECWPRFGSNMESVLATGNAVIEEKVCHTSVIDGRTTKSFWNYCASPIFEAGQVVGVYKTDQNITDQVNAFNALAESDERLALALSGGSCIGTWDWDIKRDRVSVEKRFALFFGIDPQRGLTGLPSADFLRNIHVEDHELVSQAMARAIQNGEEYSVEYRLLQADGSTHWVSAKGRCIYGDSGEPTRFPGAVFDLGPGKHPTNRRKSDLTPAQDASSVPLQTARPSIVLPLGPSDRRRSRTIPPPPPDRSSSPALVAFLVEFIARQIAERKDMLRVRTVSDLISTEVILCVAPEDIARFSGTNGRTAHSIQVVLNAASLKRDHRYTLVLEELPSTEAEPISELLQ